MNDIGVILCRCPGGKTGTIATRTMWKLAPKGRGNGAVPQLGDGAGYLKPYAPGENKGESSFLNSACYLRRRNTTSGTMKPKVIRESYGSIGCD